MLARPFGLFYFSTGWARTIRAIDAKDQVSLPKMRRAWGLLAVLARGRVSFAYAKKPLAYFVENPRTRDGDGLGPEPLATRSRAPFVLVEHVLGAVFYRPCYLQLIGGDLAEPSGDHFVPCSEAGVTGTEQEANGMAAFSCCADGELSAELSAGLEARGCFHFWSMDDLTDLYDFIESAVSSFVSRSF